MLVKEYAFVAATCGSFRHNAFCPIRQRVSERTSQARAQAQSAMEAPSSHGPVVRENLKAPEALKHVKRVNPMSDRFEVSCYSSASLSQ